MCLKMGLVSSGRKMRRDTGVKKQSIASQNEENKCFSTSLFLELGCTQENAKGSNLMGKVFSRAAHSDIWNSLLPGAADAG